MKLKRITEIYEQTPEILPSDDKLAELYPNILNKYDRRNQYRIDKHREEQETTRQRYADKEEKDKLRDIELEKEIELKLKQKGIEAGSVESGETEKRLISRNNEDKKSEIMESIGEMLTISLNNKDESFYNDLIQLVNKYPNIKRVPLTKGARVIDADTPFKDKPIFVESFTKYRK